MSTDSAQGFSLLKGSFFSGTLLGMSAASGVPQARKARYDSFFSFYLLLGKGSRIFGTEVSEVVKKLLSRAPVLDEICPEFLKALDVTQL